MRRVLSVFLFLCLVVGTTGCGGGGQTTTGKFTIGMVTDVGGLNDQSFNQSAWAGITKVKNEQKADIKALESKRDEDYIPNLTRFAREGRSITWAIGFKLDKALTDVSNSFANQKFGIVDSNLGGKIPKNVVAVTFKEHEGSFIMGALAGLKTKTNKVGFLGGVTSPLIQKFEAGYKAGVKAANPNAEVITAYAESFGDATKGRSLSKNMFNSGADIIFQASGGTGKGLFDEVKTREAGKYWAIGVDMDQSFLAPKHTLSSMIKRVDKAVYDISKQTKENKAPMGKQVEFGLKENGVGYPESTKNFVDENVIKQLEDYKQQIISGKIKVPSSL
ncbi:BMP family lipoprotein [Shimazuella kribbensis]|uniref:BMP family lipoprotein n=1 Tax=Shimazuella kribbensis TaxID=139808 RepID=UPI00042623D2|nr:BMP family ABC transporter substrate-binding protein [Shimazuella kribbensis]